MGKGREKKEGACCWVGRGCARVLEGGSQREIAGERTQESRRGARKQAKASKRKASLARTESTRLVRSSVGVLVTSAGSEMGCAATATSVAAALVFSKEMLGTMPCTMRQSETFEATRMGDSGTGVEAIDPPKDAATEKGSVTTAAIMGVDMIVSTSPNSLAVCTIEVAVSTPIGETCMSGVLGGRPTLGGQGRADQSRVCKRGKRGARCAVQPGLPATHIWTIRDAPC